MATNPRKISNEKKASDVLGQQVEDYTALQPDYAQYAKALKRVLENACKDAFPEAFVQARAKTVTSFAEKCVRKHDRYPDAVNQMTDLCGGRVIVQTLAQVRDVRRFIESNFDIIEREEKGGNLDEDKFGYRDMHYIVRLPRKDESQAYAIDTVKAAALGFEPDEMAAIDAKTAEIQVRTWVQHAWADTLHDRIYKTNLKYPAEFRRTAALLAAIMEEGDRDFDRLAHDIDGMMANFNAYAPREEVQRELDVQELILAMADTQKKPGIALQIARLVAAEGDYERVVRELTPYADIPSALGCAIRVELGHALCKANRRSPESEAYRRGQRTLEHVVTHCRDATPHTAVDGRRRASILARALARLAWAYEAYDDQTAEARACYREALDIEPRNPYYLADVIGHEISYTRCKDITGVLTGTIKHAIDTCCEHIRNGTEMPYAAFTAGRLYLLRDEPDRALGAYARGIRHTLDCNTCVPDDALALERKWLTMVTGPDPLTEGYRWCMDLLELAQKLLTETDTAADSGEPRTPPDMPAPILIVAGGATSLKPGQADPFRLILTEALRDFTGTVIAGGTKVGVPGCVGDIAEGIGRQGKRPFRLLGYLPRVRPGDAPQDDRYDAYIECGEHSFTAEQILRNWKDILEAGIRPEEVRLLGFGGGGLSAVEYRIALGFGACVGLIEGSGGVADALLNDDLWATASKDLLLTLPFDPGSVRALVHPPRAQAGMDEATLEQMGMAFHKEFVRNSANRLPDNMKPWEKLPDTYRTANLEQAKYAVQILEACGFGVRAAQDPSNPVVFDADNFSTEEIEHMAELEHGRWNIERLRAGWRPGKPRNDAQKIHDCLVPWNDLPDGESGVKKYDRAAVRKFPEILAQAGLEVHRPKQ